MCFERVALLCTFLLSLAQVSTAYSQPNQPTNQAMSQQCPTPNQQPDQVLRPRNTNSKAKTTANTADFVHGQSPTTTTATTLDRYAYQPSIATPPPKATIKGEEFMVVAGGTHQDRRHEGTESQKKTSKIQHLRGGIEPQQEMMEKEKHAENQPNLATATCDTTLAVNSSENIDSNNNNNNNIDDSGSTCDTNTGTTTPTHLTLQNTSEEGKTSEGHAVPPDEEEGATSDVPDGINANIHTFATFSSSGDAVSNSVHATLDGSAAHTTQLLGHAHQQQHMDITNATVASLQFAGGGAPNNNFLGLPSTEYAEDHAGTNATVESDSDMAIGNVEDSSPTSCVAEATIPSTVGVGIVQAVLLMGLLALIAARKALRCRERQGIAEVAMKHYDPISTSPVEDHRTVLPSQLRMELDQAIFNLQETVILQCPRGSSRELLDTLAVFLIDVISVSILIVVAHHYFITIPLSDSAEIGILVGLQGIVIRSLMASCERDAGRLFAEI